jgi:hypothetical protein
LQQVRDATVRQKRLRSVLLAVVGQGIAGSENLLRVVSREGVTNGFGHPSRDFKLRRVWSSLKPGIFQRALLGEQRDTCLSKHHEISPSPGSVVQDDGGVGDRQQGEKVSTSSLADDAHSRKRTLKIGERRRRPETSGSRQG